MSALSIIAQTSNQTFAEMVASCPRRVRETLFDRMGIKAKQLSLRLQIGQKRDEQVKQLHEKLKASTSKPEQDLCQELIRNWLYTKRPMLKATLDFLEVQNDNGLVETEPDFFKQLSESKTQAVLEHVSVQFNPEHVGIYLKFMEAPML